MLAALTTTFALSQAFRTVPAVVVGQVGPDLGVSPQGLGVFAGAFSIAFGAMQLFIGIALDRFGPRGTILALFPFAIAGAALSTFAPSFGLLVVGQVLLGIGSAPAYISTLVFIVRRYPPRRFASLSGLTMSLGGLGMLATSTPLAFVVQTWGWRSAFAVLGVAALLAFVACLVTLDNETRDDGVSRESLREAVRAIGALVRMPETAGVLFLATILYGVFLAVRTPWLVPLFVDRHGFSLVDAGNVVLTVSCAMVVSPLLFGRLDPGGRARRYAMIGMSLVMALILAAIGLSGKGGPAIDWGLVLLLAALSGYNMFEYADVRAIYPPVVVGRVIALVNMAMFFGVALVQWLTGVIAATATAQGASAVSAVFILLAGLLTLAAFGFWLLPWPQRFDASER
jgi:predicted MFS family arabinose efflux permease